MPTFVPQSISNSNQTGLPSNQVPNNRSGIPTRNIINWFVPEVGIVNMYINPQNITYSSSKIIDKQLTKGGFIIQYWGEQLTTLRISGHTGSSGIEGINVLYEIYRAEQYMFDPLALSMAANNSIAGLNSAVDAALGNLGGLNNSVVNSTGGIMNVSPTSQNILPTTIPSLASMALGVEMYYAGWVYRGYFQSFTLTETADRLGMMEYTIEFISTQRRGYRVNTFDWNRSAISGPSNNSSNGGIPLSYTDLE